MSKIIFNVLYSGLALLVCFFGSIPAFIICKIITKLKERLAQPISSVLPQHQSKAGTPTLGGLAIFLYSIPVVVNFGALYQNPICKTTADTPLYLFQMSMTAIISGMILCYTFAIGFRDDLIKITSEDNKGLKKRTKFLLLLFPILILFIIFQFCTILSPDIISSTAGLNNNIFGTTLWKAFLNTGITLLFIAGYGITDGLDGLLGGISLFGLLSHNIYLFPFFKYLLTDCLTVALKADVSTQPNKLLELIKFIVLSANWPLCGSLFTFFLFNRKPAKIFMGDCGSMALGAFFGLLYINSGYNPLYLCLSIVPIINLISVGLKIGLAKVGIRYKIMAPIHHELEKHIGEVNTVRLLIGITILISAYPIYLSYQANQRHAAELPELIQAN